MRACIEPAHFVYIDDMVHNIILRRQSTRALARALFQSGEEARRIPACSLHCLEYIIIIIMMVQQHSTHVRYILFFIQECAFIYLCCICIYVYMYYICYNNTQGCSFSIMESNMRMRVQKKRIS